MRYYILQNQTVVSVPSAKEFGEWVETADRVVSKNQVGDVEVSTVFLGIDHQFYEGPPLLFETMVFGGDLDQTCLRCSTWDEAVEQHENILSEVLNRAYGYYKPN